MSAIREIIDKLQAKHPELTQEETIGIIADTLFEDFPQLLNRIELVDVDQLFKKFKSRAKVSRKTLQSRIVHQFEEKRDIVHAFDKAKAVYANENSTIGDIATQSYMTVQGTNPQSTIIQKVAVGSNTIFTESSIDASDTIWPYSTRMDEPNWAEKIDKQLKNRKRSHTAPLSRGFLDIVGMIDEELEEDNETIEKRIVGE